jgi:outer membrane murein-binding lipoprotein Lpp
MSNLIHVDVDASELEAKMDDLEALEAKVEELTNQVVELEASLSTLHSDVHEANPDGDSPAGIDDQALNEEQIRDLVLDLVHSILQDATISIDF